MKRGDRICIKALVMNTPDKGVVEARTKHGTKIYVHPKDTELMDKVMIDLDPDEQQWAVNHPDMVRTLIRKAHLDYVLTQAELGLQEVENENSYSDGRALQA